MHCRTAAVLPFPLAADLISALTNRDQRDIASVTVPHNILATKGTYRVQMALPGLTPADVDVEAAGPRLTVTVRPLVDQPSGTTADSKEDTVDSSQSVQSPKEAAEETIHRGFNPDSFRNEVHSFEMPEDADLKAIKATLRNGVLDILVPRLKPESVRIAVSVG